MLETMQKRALHSKSISEHSLLIISFVLSIVLMTLVAFSPSKLLYDEGLHLEGARMLQAGVALRELLSASLPSAPGPIYPVLHSTLYPLTHFQSPAIRWINIFLLAISIYVTGISMQSMGMKNHLALSVMMLAIPMVWVTSGMALTEIPAFFLATLSLFVAIKGTQQSNKIAMSITFMGSGMLAGLTVLSRQTYLPALVGFLMLAAFYQRTRLSAALGFLTACVLVYPVFRLWGGIVPQSQAHTGGGVVFLHGILAFAYLGVALLILTPKFYQSVSKLALPVMAVCALCNVLFIRLEYSPMATLSARIPSHLRSVYSFSTSTLLLSIFSMVVAAIVLNCWQRRSDSRFHLFSVISVLLTATSFGVVHLFSSRYVMTAFPFALIMAQPYFVPSKWAALRLLLGATLGCAVLASYYSL